MLKIGEFSRLSQLTIKALRYYEKENLLLPAFIDSNNGYRFYEYEQLEIASKIKDYRQLGLAIDEIRMILNGDDAAPILIRKANELQALKKDIDYRLSLIHHILEADEL